MSLTPEERERILGEKPAAPPPAASETLRERLVGVQLDHETSYSQKDTEEWLWSCSCGETCKCTSRDECHLQTRKHWADVVLAAIRRDAAQPTEQERIVACAQLAGRDAEIERLRGALQNLLGACPPTCTCGACKNARTALADKPTPE